MKSKHELYSLICNMDRSERGYFKKYAYKGGQKDSDILSLYEYISKNCKKLDFDNLEERCRKNFSNGKSYASSKKYLYDLILQVLVDYHKPKKYQQELLDQTRAANILIRKGMLKAAIKKLEAVIGKAMKYELFEVFFPALFSLATHYINNNESSKLKSLRLLHRNFLEKYIQYEEVLAVEYKFFEHCQNGIVKTEDKRRLLNKDIADLPLEFELRTNRAKLFYYDIQCMDAWMKGEPERIFINNQKKVKIYENEDLVDLRTKLILREYRGLINSSIAAQDYELALYYLERLELLEDPKDKSFFSYKMTSFYYLKLTFYLKQNMFDAAASLILQVKRFYNKYSLGTDTYAIGMVYLCSYLSLILDQFNEVLFWNAVFEEKFGHLKENLYKSEIKVMSVIVHYELDNYDYLPYLIRNLEREFNQKAEFHVYERIILKQIKKALRSIDKYELQEVYKETLNELLEKEDSEAFKYFIHAFDALNWLRAKIENKAFRQCLEVENESVLV